MSGGRAVRRHPVRAAIVGAGAAVAVIAGSVIAVSASASVEADAGAAVPAASASATPAAPPSGFSAGGMQDPAPAADEAEYGRPETVRIPAIGVETTLVDLELGDGGELEAPADYDRAGWYADGVAPGDVGPAIIAGHVDSPSAPAVFARIGELSEGDEIIVSTSSGDELTFVVSHTAQSAKSNFPTDAVYDNVPRPELRLITCAGDFDSAIGHYTDNLIVFAALR